MGEQSRDASGPGRRGQDEGGRAGPRRLQSGARAALRPQRIPGTKGFPETEETELAMPGRAKLHQVKQAEDARPEPEKDHRGSPLSAPGGDSGGETQQDCDPETALQQN